MPNNDLKLKQNLIKQAKAFTMALILNLQVDVSHSDNHK